MHLLYFRQIILSNVIHIRFCGSKQCAIDLQKTKDTFKASVNRAPFVDLTAVWETVIETNEAVAGPDMPLEAYID